MILVTFFSAALLPVMYFYEKNFTLFEKLAYDFYPQLINNLKQEETWLWITFTVSHFFLFGVSLFFSLKFTKKILYPIHQIEKHLQKMMLGHWDEPIHFDNEKEDFKSIKISYDYFQRSLKANTEMELELLKKIAIDPNNRDSYLAWKNLIEYKSYRIGLNPEEVLKGINPKVDDLIYVDFKKNKLKKVI
ncbi:MAG: hypothetical protein HUU56_12850 [Bdellovibrionaceae bacterium]|nr:hypothetical protein [Pseudobdellovibrionaceae bacterium]